MKSNNVMKRFMALLLTVALMVGMVGTEALAAMYPEWDLPSDSGNGDSTAPAPDHVHNQDGWLCTQGDSTWELTCRQEEHTHTSACYAPADPEKALACGMEEAEGHTHTEGGYEVTTTYSCGLEEKEGHVHDESCYGERPLICEQEEATGHVHIEDCYTTESELVCEIPENHVHTVDCYIIGEPGQEMELDGVLYTVTGLNCTIPENHTHTEECHGETTTLTCTEETSEGHAHTDACYGEAELICELEEEEGHKHSEECTQEEKTLVCEQEEAEGHQHTDECYGEVEAPALICGQEEMEGHVHGLSCYVERQVLICGQEESGPVVSGNKDYYDETDVYYPGHQHDTSCWEVQKTLVCEEKAVEPHVHTADCYEGGVMPAQGELICSMEEHVHTDECYGKIEGEWTCTQAENAVPSQYAQVALNNKKEYVATPATRDLSEGKDFADAADPLYQFRSSDQYLYYQRSPHTANDKGSGSMPAIYQLADTLADKYLLVYCSDLETPAKPEVNYQRQNIESSWYALEISDEKERKETIAELRGIVLNSYPHISAEVMYDNMVKAGVKFSCQVDIGQMISATQFAIWHLSNGDKSSQAAYNKTTTDYVETGPGGKSVGGHESKVYNKFASDQ